MWPGAYGARSKHYFSTLCPWKLDDLEYDELCSHSLLMDFITLSIHFREAIELATEELAEKAAEQWAPADEKAEQKGIWDEDKAVGPAERAKPKALAD
jgi:hypothetical protein